MVAKSKPRKRLLHSGLKTHTSPQPTPPPLQIVGFTVVPPLEWSESKRQLSLLVEMSLIQDPRFPHLSVLPPGSWRPVMGIL